jgi:hypothetical protein
MVSPKNVRNTGDLGQEPYCRLLEEASDISQNARSIPRLTQRPCQNVIHRSNIAFVGRYEGVIYHHGNG